MRAILARLLDVLLRRSREDRLDAEVQSHLDLLADDFAAKGMSRADAVLAARKAFGGVDQIKERYRDQRGFRIFDDLARDVTLALRLLTREPGFVLATVGSLGIGIGASTTIFTIANGVLLRPPAGVADSESLIDITRASDGEGFGIHEMSFPNYLDLRERATTLADICAYEPIAIAMSVSAGDTNAGAERVFGHNVTPNYFSVLGVTAAAGRLFGGADTTESAVLSHRYWTRRFGADPAVLGRVIRVNGQPLTISGVTDAAFVGTSLVATDLWVAIDMAPPPDSYRWRRGLFWAVARARLKAGVTRPEAIAQIDAIGRLLEVEYPETNSGTRFRAAAVSALPGDLAVPLSGVFSLVFLFVSLVLVAACANLASLLLARGTVRRREVAVRLALGSSRGRLIRQLLTETLLLFVLGGALGLVVARGTTSLLISVLPVLPVPLQVDLPIDASVALFTTALSLLTAIAAGVMPALESARTDVTSTLKHQNAASTPPSRLRHAFVIVQIACGMVLIIGAALFTRALSNAVSADRGFDQSRLVMADLDLSLGGYNQQTAAAFLERAGASLRSNPVIESVTFAANVPGRGRLRLGSLALPDRPHERRDADWNAIEPGFFRALGIEMKDGRDFDATDRRGGAPVAIISEETARRLWPGQSVVGKYFHHEPANLIRGQSSAGVERLIVGVVADVRNGGGNAPMQVYVPLSQQYLPRLTLLVRGANADAAAAALRASLAAADANVPITAVQTLEAAASADALPRRVAATVSTALAGVSLLLATIGVYGITAYAAARQAKEVGIRMSLGATAPAIRLLLARAGLRIIVIGCAIGSIAAIAAARALQNSLPGFPGLDPMMFLSGLAVFTATVMAASWIPAMRASRVDPMISLRQD